MKIQIAANPVVAKILDVPDEIRLEIVELLSYAIPGSEHMSRGGDWSGRSTLFSFANSTFPAGLLSLVITKLRQMGHQVQVLRKPAPEPLGKPFPQVNEFPLTERYKYQYETVEQLIKHRQCIAQVSTGGGKSLIAAITVAWIKRPTLFLTTRSVLMHQMKRTFEKSLAWRAANGEPEMGKIRVGVMGDGEFSPTKSVCVGMVQTIQAKLKDKDPAVRQRMKEILSVYQLVILEEAHEASGAGYYEIMGLCVNADYRLALTGTPFMREDEEANMKLMACAGPVAIRVTEKQLIDAGILATPIFKYIETPSTFEVRRSSDWQRAYHYGIVKNERRNTLIAVEAKRAARLGLPVMILVQRKEHGKILKDMIAEEGVKVRYIFGESDTETRDQALNDLRDGKTNVLIGSTIMDVGVDVPAVGMVILAGAGKAEVALRQRIGRGLRAKKTGPNICYVIDFADQRNKHLVNHSAQRRAIVEGTPGFAENILPPGEDFDFTVLNKKAA